jgi:hypothetical protein
MYNSKNSELYFATSSFKVDAQIISQTMTQRIKMNFMQEEERK